MPRVALITTSWNREKFLGQTIQSVLDQSFTDFEYLIWDDGSNDASPLIAASYARNDARIRVIRAAHQGRIRALVQAINQSKAPYIGWLDSDDLLAPKALEKTVAILDAQPKTGLVYTDYWDFGGQKWLDYGKRSRLPYTPTALLTDFMVFHFRLFRRTCYERVGGLNTAVPLAEDYDLCLRLSEITEFHHLRQALYFYRHHPNQLSKKQPIAQMKACRKVIENALKRRGLDDGLEVHLEIQGHYAIRRKDSHDRFSCLGATAR